MQCVIPPLLARNCFAMPCGRKPAALRLGTGLESTVP